MNLRDNFQELRELGLGGSAYRLAHELRMRSGAARIARLPASVANVPCRSLPFATPTEVCASLVGRIDAVSRDALLATAKSATHGRILTFGRWIADYGDPIDWHLQPVSGMRWNASRHWSQAVSKGALAGDVKLTWEVGRFPHAYHLARAATFHPLAAAPLGKALHQQIAGFLAANPYPLGIQWNSGQECVIRLVAWLFALGVFEALGNDSPETRGAVGAYAATLGPHLEQELGYARRAVYNNHLIAEALGLYLVGWCRPDLPDAPRWRALGLDLLTEQADRQVYADGAYINQSHNYHRVVLQDYLLARALQRAEGQTPPAPWVRAMERSLDLLVAHQNPTDGRLPNHGSNDGSLPRVLSTCDFSDLRPTLQALSVATRGERIYPPGPWDEEAAWSVGAAVVDAPLREPTRRSVSFPDTGYHVLRGRDPHSFASFRCGTLRDRFAQIDMLHLDVWWRGHNVLVDGGSYLYNGPAAWHDHFLRTASHNTVTVDGHDQMLHHRRFKVLYWTRATTLAFVSGDEVTVVSGEHHGYARHPGGCIHRRSVMMAGDDLWVVCDTVTGAGSHACRLHWLAGDFAHTRDAETGKLTLTTPSGEFTVCTYDETGQPAVGNVVRGQDDPPRGWLSRYYAEKIPVPSLEIVREGALPMTLVTLLSGVHTTVTVQGSTWSVSTPARTFDFALHNGIVSPR